MSFLSEQGKRDLVGAIKAVEAASSAEVVVSVQAQSSRYVATSLVAAMLGAFAMLAFLLFSPWEFPLYRFLVDTALASSAVGLLVNAVPALKRALTPSSSMGRHVDRAASATFFDQGVRLTSDRVGILVYISVLERRVKVLADLGVTQAVTDEAWSQATLALEAALREGADASGVAARVVALQEVLRPALPRQEDDVNELPDAVVA